MKASIVSALTLAWASSALAAPKDNRAVEIDGVQYRVQVISTKEALVFNKSAVVRWSLSERDRRIEAARRATGCESGEFMMAGRALAVALACKDSRSGTASR